MNLISKLTLTLILSITSIYAERIALIVGVPSHFRGQAQDGINIDIANMSNMFSSYGFKVEKLVDSTATTQMLRKKLNQYKNLNNQDTFVFYYTGHGAQVPDNNGDEEDERDEVIVLYDHPRDGSSVGLFVDDEMFKLLSKIPAQKFVFFDSCHSGSAFKSISTEAATKSLGYLSKAMGVADIKEPSRKEKRSILFFGAAKDNQESIATPSGSMFTLTLLDGIKRSKADLNANGETTFTELLRFAVPDIRRQVENCPENWGCKIFTPEMHGTKDMLTRDMLTAMNIKNKVSSSISGDISQVEMDMDDIMNNGETKIITLNTNDFYRDGENIELKFNTGNYRGYLTIITIDSNDINVLYPNKYQNNEIQYNGSINFPRDITNKFQLSAMEPYGRTVGYVILSDEPLGLYDKGGNSIFKVLPRGNHTAQSFRKAMAIKNNDTMMIGKTVFTVERGN